jgi:murein endopeptidase
LAICARTGDHVGVRRLVVLVLMFAAATARADERYVVQRGETLEHVAAVFGCPTNAVLRANHVNTTLVRAGTVVVIPGCRSVRVAARHQLAAAAGDEHDADDDRRAQQALAVIDGRPIEAAHEHEHVDVDRQGDDQSEGRPWKGGLRDAAQLPPGDGYVIRRVGRSYGASHVVAQLQRSIAEVRGRFPGLHALAIGDLSAKNGGKLGNHLSHQSGLDVDVGFYFKHVPAGYPDSFVSADGNLDYAATWALLQSFARTADDDTGVQIIFLDYDVQARLYKWAAAHGTPRAQLEELFQYPRGKDAFEGLVRHWPHHADHFHVRFKPAD